MNKHDTYEILQSLEDDLASESQINTADKELITSQIETIFEEMADMGRDIETLNTKIEGLCDKSLLESNTKEIQLLNTKSSHLRKEFEDYVLDNEVNLSGITSRVNVLMDVVDSYKHKASAVREVVVKTDINNKDFEMLMSKIEGLESKLKDKSLIKNVVMSGGVDRLVDLKDVNLDGLQKDSQGRYILGAGGASALSELTDVELADVLDRDKIRYNSVDEKWDNLTFAPVTVTRDANGNPITIQVRNKTYTSTFVNGLVATISDTRQTATINRDASGNFISLTV